MNNSIFYTYLKFNLRYFIRRKFEIVKRSRLNVTTKILFLIKLIFSSLLLFISTIMLADYFSDYIDFIEYYFYASMFIYIVFIPLIPRTKLLINPMDKQLLYRSSLREVDIFNLIYASDVLKKFVGYFNLLIVGMAISLYHISPFIFNLKVFCALIYFSTISYVIQIIFINIKVISTKKLFSYHYCVFNFMMGSIVSVIGFVVSFLLVNLLIKSFLVFSTYVIKSKKTFEWYSYFQDIKNEVIIINEKVMQLLDYISPHTIFMRLNFVNISFVIITIALFIALYYLNKIGFWYRKEDIYLSSTNINFSLPISIKAITTIQLKHWISNKEEVNLHKPFFYISYSIWFFLGCLIYFSQMAYNQLANAVIFILILNTITRDSFSAGTDFFTKSLRFDSDRKSIGLYRMSNTDFKQIYDSKLSLIRFIGFKETILAIILLAIFLNQDIYLYIIGFEIIIINTVIIPNLSLLPSYLSPHFNHQHYSELESFEEQIFLEDTVFDKVKNFLSSSYFLILFVGYLSQRNYIDIMIFIIIFNILALILVSLFIRFSKQKITKSWRKRDLYL